MPEGRAATPVPRDAVELSARLARVRLVAFDFDGVFTDNMVYVFEDGREAVCCFRSDGLGLSKLKREGLALVVISTETNPVVGMRCRKLGLRCVQGCEDKRAALEAIVSEGGLSLDQVAYVGNDINDLACLQIAGVPIVVADAHPDVIGAAAYRTKIPGGRGAVREICDLIVSARAQQKVSTS